MAVNVTGSFNFNIIQMHKIEWNCIAIHNCDSKCLIFAYFFKSRISVWVDLVFLKKTKSFFLELKCIKDFQTNESGSFLVGSTQTLGEHTEMIFFSFLNFHVLFEQRHFERNYIVVIFLPISKSCQRLGRLSCLINKCSRCLQTFQKELT